MYNGNAKLQVAHIKDTYTNMHYTQPCIFTARRYASAVYAMALCLSVRQAPCPLVKVGVKLISKRQNVASRK